jgi:hypothetical protein
MLKSGVLFIGGPSLSSTGDSGKSTGQVSCTRLETAGQPCAGDLPIALHRDDGDAEHFGRFVFL